MSKRQTNTSQLAKIRIKAGYTQAEAAILLDIGVKRLGRYETGLNDMTFRIGEKMAEIYNVPFEDIRQAVLANKKISNDENSTNTKNKPEVIKEIERKRNKRKTNKTILMEALNEAEKWKKSQLS